MAVDCDAADPKQKVSKVSVASMSQLEPQSCEDLHLIFCSPWIIVAKYVWPVGLRPDSRNTDPRDLVVAV